VTPTYRWGSAVFVAFGEAQWTEADAAAFVDRVGEIVREEAARNAKTSSPLEAS
jgi:hypothetical protein